jgi:L-fuculose-phosphate aldolase
MISHVELLLRQELCEAGRRLHELGLVGASEGNLSARLDEEYLLTTPRGRSKGSLDPEEIVKVDFAGVPAPGELMLPSSELKVHLKVYEMRPDAQAVIHAHPSYATGFAVAGLSIPSGLLPEADMVLGKVAWVPFGMPGTQEAADQLEAFLPEHDSFLLSHHGTVTVSRSVPDCMQKMETLERIAKVLFVARALGGEKPLPEAAQQQLEQLTSRTGFTR